MSPHAQDPPSAPPPRKHRPSHTPLPSLVLYDTPSSPYSTKIRLALREKNLPFTTLQATSLGEGNTAPSELATANPRLETPTLIHDGFPVFESSIILQYLDDAFPKSRQLMPGSAKAKAQVAMLQQVCDGPLDGAIWAILEVEVYGRTSADKAKRMVRGPMNQISQCLAWLEMQLGKGEEGEREWFVDGKFGAADVAVFPFVNLCDVHGWGPQEGTAMRGWLERMRERRSVEETNVEVAMGLEGMKKLKGSRENPFAPGAGGRRLYRDHRLEAMIKAGGLEIVNEGLKKKTIRFSWPDAGV